MDVCGADERERRLILAGCLIMYCLDLFKTINILKDDIEEYFSNDSILQGY